MGNRAQTNLEDLFQEILVVHTVPVKQEKELVNLPRQQKFIHKTRLCWNKMVAKQQPGTASRTQGCTGRKSHRTAKFRPQIQKLLIKAI